jgi:tetratricopeptide (TPR) repeat protein
MSQNNFQEAMNLGHTAAWDQKWEDAAEFYRRALELLPQDSKALISMGLAMFELGRYEESLMYYSNAGTSNPDDPLPFEKIAQIAELIERVSEVPKPSLRAAELYLELGEVERAIENLARVTRADMGNLAAHSRLAVIYERQGRKGQAVTEYLTVASLLQQVGQADNAIKAVRRALTITPDSKEAQRTLDLLTQGKSLPKPARTHFDTNRYREAVSTPAHTQRVIRSEPVKVDPVLAARQKALEDLAGLIFEPIDSKLDEGSRDQTKGFQAFMRGSQKSQISKKVDQEKMLEHLRSAVDFQIQGPEGKASDELNQAMENGLDHPAAFFDMGFIQVHQDRLDSAIRNLLKATESEEYALGAHLLLGETFRKMEREDRAALEYLRALRIADSQVVPSEIEEDVQQLYDTLIEAESTQTDLESKTRICDTVSDLLRRPDWRERVEQARRDFQIDVKDGPAIPLGEVISQASGSRIIESIMNIHNLARQGYMRSAMEEAYFALQHAPTYLPLHTYMGELLLQQDRIAEAIAKFNTIAQTYSARGETDKAIPILRRVIRTAPMNINGRLQLIEILESLDKREEAVHEYLDLANVYYNLADLEQAQGAYSKALNLASTNGKNNNLIVQILHNIADINLQSLDWRRALKIYDQIRSIDPGDAKARENLIEVNLRLSQPARAETELEDYLLYLKSTGQTQEETVFLERVCAENPDQVFLRRNLIDHYKQLGQSADAIRLLDSMGEAAIESGNRSGAIRIIEEIMDLDPPNRSDYQVLLNQIRNQ